MSDWDQIFQKPEAVFRLHRNGEVKELSFATWPADKTYYVDAFTESFIIFGPRTNATVELIRNAESCAVPQNPVLENPVLG